MLLRTGVLLLFCVTASMCATLVNYQTSQKEVDATSPIVAASEEAASPPAAEKPEPNSLLSNNMSSEIHAVEKLAADRPEVDVSVADGAGTDSDRPAGDTPSLEAFSGEAVASKQPSSSAEEDNDIRPIGTRSPYRPSAQDDSGWSLKAIRNSFQTVHGYFDSLVELAGGHNGVCQYRCRYGKLPQRRPGYQLSHPDGCSYSLMGFQLDLGIPAMTKCCNELDVCYETCGTRKYDCDSEFRLCLHGICSDINKSLGFSSNVEACGSAADALYNTVSTLGCPSYMNSQRAACICDEEERDEL